VKRPNGAKGLLCLLLSLLACNSDVPVSASVDLPSVQMYVTITRVATHPFLSRYNLRLTVKGPKGCMTEATLFPDTGYVSRRNLYVTPAGLLYVVGQFDARVVDGTKCKITLSEFRHLERDVTFLGTFDEQEEGRWTFVPAAQRRELPFEKL
jgi:hypothetical protein